MSYVLDNPDIGSTRVLDDPTALASSGLQGVTGTLTVTGFAAAMALRGATGFATVTGRYAGFQPAPGGLLDVTPDPSGHPLSVEIVSGPAHGTLQIEADGHFTFAPDSGWFGTDSFDYRVWANGSPGASATVVLTLAASMQGVTGTVTVDGRFGAFASAAASTLARTIQIAIQGPQGGQWTSSDMERLRDRVRRERRRR